MPSSLPPSNRSPVLLTALCLLGLLLGCESSPPPSPPAADAVIDSAVAAHGGRVLDQVHLAFRFRGDRYVLRQYNGRFHYRRTYTDSLDRRVRDGLTNDGVYRTVAGDTVALSDAQRENIHTTVNSVSYFVLLPEPLQDAAVQPEYSGRDTLNGTPYHRIRVTFQKEGGGSDWEDVFLYWFRTDTYAMDYLAYAFGLGDDDTDPGTRFRAAYNLRRINDVRVADYKNYTAAALPPARMARYPTLWAADSLDLVSTIEIDSVQVRPLSSTP